MADFAPSRNHAALQATQSNHLLIAVSESMSLSQGVMVACRWLLPLCHCICICIIIWKHDVIHKTGST